MCMCSKERWSNLWQFGKTVCVHTEWRVAQSQRPAPSNSTPPYLLGEGETVSTPLLTVTHSKEAVMETCGPGTGPSQHPYLQK